MSVEVIDKGHDAIARLVHEMSGARAPYAAVGVQGSEASAAKVDGDGKPTDDLTNVDVSIVHEFGVTLPNGTVIPQRSFLAGTLDAHASEIRAFKAKLARGLVAGKLTAQRATQLVGMKVEGLIKERISAGIEPGLEQSTIDRKGSSKPLVDFGQLRNGVTHTVRRGR